MAASDKARNKVDRVRGRAKEAAGRVLRDPTLERQGRFDQRVSHLKDAVEKIKGAFRSRSGWRPPR
jgi:uncharacterized protein YjbJ (UPF0337 family)